MNPLSTDDLLWLIGQKEATLLLVSRQAQALIADNERLKKELDDAKKATVTDASNNGQTADATVLAEAPGGTSSD